MPKLSEKLLAQGFPTPSPNSRIAHALRRTGVPKTPELSRILALPRRKLCVVNNRVEIEKVGKRETIPDLTPIFKTPSGTMTLRPLQNAALWDAYTANGGFFSLAVGEGKTLVTLLLPEAMNSKKAVLLVKPELRNQLLKKDVPFYRKHFNLPLDRIYVVAYTELSSAKKADILERIQPDLLISDESHKLRVKSSTRTRRFLRYMRSHPECRFVALSGTMAKRSLTDYAHLIELALRKNSPLPNNFKDLEEWSEAIDITDDPRPPGALLELCDSDETVRQGFRRRVVETLGVVASDDMSIGTSLVIAERPLKIPEKIEKELKRLYATWQIEEEELADAMALMRVARQIVCGFYYKWKWQNGIRDEEWILARRAWHREIRGYLLHSSREGLDSPFLLAKAAMEGRWKSEHWGAWNAVRARIEPETIPVWLHDFMVADAIRWGKSAEKENGGIIWYEHGCIGEAIARLGEWKLYGAGADASMVDIRKEPVIVCSIKAQSEGKNLQSWQKCLVTTPPANGSAWEQLLGRCHRQGQTADEILVDVYLHTREFKSAFEQATKDAEFVEQTQGQKQKLLFATKVIEDGL